MAKKYSPQNDAKWLSDNHDFILIYAKSKLNWTPRLLPRTAEMNARYKNPDNDPKGAWKLITLHAKSGNNPSFSYTFNNGVTWQPPSGTYPRFSAKTLKEYNDQGKIWFGTDGNSVPAVKNYLCEVKQGVTPLTIWTYDEVGHNQTAKEDVKKCFDGKNPFDTPKPVSLLKRICYIANLKDNDIVLDFFSGSATTAHAVMQLNAEDGGHRKFIMIQLPESCDEKSEAYKADYKNICEIGKERIRRAGAKIREENPMTTAELDTGFRVLKLDSTNMTDVYYSPLEINQQMLLEQVENIKPGRTDLDLLFGCLLDWGIPLNMPYVSENIDGCTVHTYNDGDLIACFDKNVPESVVKAIAKRQPLRVVFRDSCFEDSPSKINVGEIFKMIAPDTRVKVI